MLHRFSVKSMVMCLVGSEVEEKGKHSERDQERIKEATKFSHQSLKVVEMRAFKGLDCEVELLQHLFEIGAQSLEKAVIDTRTPLLDRAKVEPVRNLARSLGEGFDSRVQFAVL